jgi:hypothetical protein
VRTVALLSGAALSAAVLTACDSGATEPPFLPETSPTPTEEATSAPEATPAATPADLESFRAFAPQIEAAVEARDADFFMDIANISSVTCPEGLEPRCESQPPGTIVEGIHLGRWLAEGSLLSVDDFREGLRHYLASLVDPTLYAIAGPGRNISGMINAPAFFAVVASTDDLANTTRVFAFVAENGEWRMPVVINTSNLAADWLSGECSICYDHWERWEGTP